MTTTADIHPPRPQSFGDPQTAGRGARRSDVDSPIADGLVDLSLVAAVPFGLPPVGLLGGWLLFALMLAGSFALLVTFSLVVVALLALTAAILAPPYLLFLVVRHLRRSPGRLLGRHQLRQRFLKRGLIGVNLRPARLGIQRQTHVTSKRI
jgi:hypothetical protein